MYNHSFFQTFFKQALFYRDSYLFVTLAYFQPFAALGIDLFFRDSGKIFDDLSRNDQSCHRWYKGGASRNLTFSTF